MTEIICCAITGAVGIICAVINHRSATADKERKAAEARADARAEQRAKESRLLLQYISANSELTVGVAMALKNGHCNGEVEAGLESVKQANAEYIQFLESIAIDQLNR